MPFFFKLADYETDRKKWLADVEFLLCFIIGECAQRRHDSVRIFAVTLNGLDERHIHRKAAYEYYTDVDVPSRLIYDLTEHPFTEADVDASDMFVPKLRSQARKRLIKFIDANKHVEHGYIHATCDTNIEPICQHGICNVPQHMKLGDTYGGRRCTRKRRRHSRKAYKAKPTK